MSVTGGALPNEPTWQGNLESLEHEIESLRTDSSSQQTARIRACVATSLQSLNKESAPSIKDFNQRCTDLQSHLSRLEALCNEPKLFGVFRPDKIRMSRIFGSKTKSSVQEVCKRIQEIMKKFLKDKVSEGVGDKQSIDEEIEKIQEPWHMQIALACSANSCFSGNAQDRISLLSQIKELSPNHNLDYPTVLSLISLIPEEERTPRNIALFINATKDMTKADSQTFVINMRNIPYENRVYTLQSVVDYLNIGVRSSNDKICQLLQASNRGYTGLHLAVMFGSREALGELLDRSDFGVNIRDHSGQTPLYLAAKSGDKELVDLLLSIEKTDVNLSDLSDCTPLHIAIQFGRKEVIESLLKNKNIDVNLFDGKGETSIYLALQSGNKELVEALIPRTTININHRYRDGKTLLDMAVRSGNKEIVELLLKIKGINVNLSDREGFTPLFVASGNGNMELAELLIKNGADPMFRGRAGATPYMLYKMEGIEVPPTLAEHPDELGYRLKMAALIWGLGGKTSLEKGKKFELEVGTISVPLSEEIGNFSFLPENVRAAFSQVKAGRSADEIAESINHGALTVIPAGFEGHAMCLVFYQDMLFVCNRGGGSEKGALRCFSINREKVTSEEIQKLMAVKGKDEVTAIAYYYDSLPTSLANGGAPIEITSEFSDFEPSKQKVGNCSAASLKLAIRVALAAVAYKQNGNTLPEGVALEGYLTSKRATRELRERSYQALVKEMDESRLDPAIKAEVLKLFEKKRQELERKAKELDSLDEE